MIKILLVQDRPETARLIVDALEALDVVPKPEVRVTPDYIGAKRELIAETFDLLILDIIIPKRFGDTPSAANGRELLSAINDEKQIKKPKYIVGITADRDVYQDTEELFKKSLWFLLRVSPDSTTWLEAIQAQTKHIIIANGGDAQPSQITRHDIGIITALSAPEFAAVKALPVDWKICAVRDDSTEYITTRIETKNENMSVVAATATQMGMTATAVVAAKMILHFRPRYLIMVGIAAGYKDMCRIGDILVCDQTWDTGSGKFVREKDVAKFLPDPRVISLHGHTKDRFVPHVSGRKYLDEICSQWKQAKPAHELNLHIGPLVSGAAVIADEQVAIECRKINRKIVGLDMETYATFYACDHVVMPAPIPLSIKAVSDYADERKGDGFQAYAAYTSAAFVYKLILDGFFG